MTTRRPWRVRSPPPWASISWEPDRSGPFPTNRVGKKTCSPVGIRYILPMEPTSTPRGRGRGSLESPEVHEEVPGHVIPILEREFDDFDTEAAKFQRGETPENEFIGFRLKQGVYGQRQPDVQMVRVKL